jgi:hypothetical protein
LRSEVTGIERAAFYVDGEVFESTDDEVCTAAEGEGEAVTGEAAVGFEDAVGGRIVGILVDGVGANVFA